MAEIRRSYDNQDDIPESYRGMYIEQGGMWKLPLADDDGSKNAEDVRKALSARDNERKVAADLRKQIEDLKGKLGDFDPERLPDAMDALNKIDEMEQQKLINEKRFEEAAERKFQRQIAEMKRQIETLSSSLEAERNQRQQVFEDFKRVTIQEGLRKEFIEAGIDPDFLDAAIHLESQKWELDEESREPRPFELIDGGKTKVTATGADGKPLTMREQARTFLRDKPKWAMPSNGSNASHQGSGSSGNSQFAMSRDEARRDNRKYEMLQEKARAAGQEVSLTGD